MTTITQVITTLPTAPARSQPAATFITNADAHVASLSTLVSEINTWRGQANTVAGEVNTNATNSAASAVSAAAAQIAAESASNATVWVSGTTYANGDVRWSPIDFQSYRRKTNGAGTTDPSADATNWQKLGTSGISWLTKTTTYTAAAGEAIMSDTTSSAWTLTLPATPSANNTVLVADYAGTFATNNLTIGRNGNKIMGLSENMVISTNNVSITLVYIDATRGWAVV